MQCTNCEQFIYKGTKFNAKKCSTNETYLDIRLFDLCFRCSSCSAEVTLRTDPASGGYVIRSGAKKLDAQIESNITSGGNSGASNQEQLIRPISKSTKVSGRIRKPLPLPTRRRNVVKDV